MAAERTDKLAPAAPSLAPDRLRSPSSLSRWAIDPPIPAHRSREVAAGFCGALLARLGPAVEDVVLQDRLAVVALPQLPVPAGKGRVNGVGVLVDRNRADDVTGLLRDAIRSIGISGFEVGDRPVRLKRAAAGAVDDQRWMGPGRTWTSVTPWISETSLLGRAAHVRDRCLRDSLARALSGDPEVPLERGIVDGFIRSAQTHDEAWIAGVPAASQGPPFRPGPPVHVRITFNEPVEGPIVIGRDRLFGMGLLVPMDMPSEPFED